jgi:hypothetical protein
LAPVTKSWLKNKIHHYLQKEWTKRWQGIFEARQEEEEEEKIYRFFQRGAKLGVDVMITIFCDFPQFSAKKLAFFQKPML